ncbi:hypothetical protein F4083_06660 [Candidatus Poribacteria bacterium]|nr:hypothetical protein [Candidatus Poribacteria bacterium]MYB64656.1 hypothetical protein [Candidatus Poribacteria bacterium]MYF55675.1 hypothetical protein [Candidatus Poribacteria bacterium]MYI93992.1 hypothetical protein [Candidatus Poribacteria bacterium]
MQFWKLVLIVIAIGIFLMALGAWFGYRYISEQDEIRPTVGIESSNTGYALIIVFETTSITAENATISKR